MTTKPLPAGTSPPDSTVSQSSRDPQEEDARK